ncbi:MAG: MarR family transcriptional regulator [Acidimicrobiaceae bacterium]|jgi:DNA-binding MarR family transcriptional regulator|nr:MarR family transcriptional regulator [Acidimicrobiaceae bacterium]
MDGTEGERDTAKVAVRLSVALKRLRSRLREESGMTSTGFTLSQLALLDHLLAQGPSTAASLAAAEHVSQQAIAQSVATLKAAGLITTGPHPSDGRKVLIDITAAGRRLFESLLESREMWLVRAIDANMGPKDRASLDVAVELLERLAAADLRPEIDIR